MTRHDRPLTQLIQLARGGDQSARDRLFEEIYGELKLIARGVPRLRAGGEAESPTTLTHEVFVLLERRFPPPPADMPESRATFYRSVALAMRTLVRDEWRKARAAKRRAPAAGGTLHSMGEDGKTVDMLELDDAMERLCECNERWFNVVMYRFYGGRSVATTAELLGVSERTVKRDWQLARGWLSRELGGSRLV